MNCYVADIGPKRSNWYTVLPLPPRPKTEIFWVTPEQVDLGLDNTVGLQLLLIVANFLSSAYGQPYRRSGAIPAYIPPCRPAPREQLKQLFLVSTCSTHTRPTAAAALSRAIHHP